MAKLDFNFKRAGGMAGGLYAVTKLDTMDFVQNLDPKLAAAGKIFLGDWLPKQKFVSGMVKDKNLVDGVGLGIMANGITGLMSEFGISGIGESVLADDDILAVAIEGDASDEEFDFFSGIDDLDTINDDDLDTINDDDDDPDYVDDLPAMNEDVLSDDDFDY